MVTVIGNTYDGLGVGKKGFLSPLQYIGGQGVHFELNAHPKPSPISSHIEAKTAIFFILFLYVFLDEREPGTYVATGKKRGGLCIYVHVSVVW